MTLYSARVLGLGATGLLQVALVQILGHVRWNAASRFLVLAGALGAIAQIGFPESVLHFGAGASPRAAKRLGLRTALALALVGLSLGTALAAIPWVGQQLLGTGQRVPLSFALYLGAELAIAPVSPLLVAQRKPRAAGAVALLSRLPVALGAIVPALLAQSLERLLLGLALGSLAAAVGAWSAVLHLLRGPGGERPRAVSLARQLAFSLPVGATRIVNTWNNYFDKLLLLPVLGVAYGSYSLGAVQIPFVLALATVSTSALSPELTRLKHAGELRAFRQLWVQQMSKLALVSLPAALWSCACAKPLFSALYPDQDAELAGGAFVVFQLLLFSRLTNYGLVCQSLGKPRLVLRAAMLSAGLNLPASIWLLKAVGPLGPAWGTVLSNYASLGYLLWAVGRELKTGLLELWPRHYGRTLLAAATPLPAVWALRSAPLSDAAYLAVSAAVYLLAYVGAARLFGALTVADLQFLRSLLRGSRPAKPA